MKKIEVIMHTTGLILLVINLLISIYIGNIIAALAWFAASAYCICLLVNTIKESNDEEGGDDNA